jgi:hypothetical protein
MIKPRFGTIHHPRNVTCDPSLMTSCSETQRDTERHRETQRDTERHRETQRDTERHREMKGGKREWKKRIEREVKRERGKERER